MDRAPVRLVAAGLLLVMHAAIAAPLAPDQLPDAPPQVRDVVPAALPDDFILHLERYLRAPDEAQDRDALERAKAAAARGEGWRADKVIPRAQRAPATAPTVLLNRPGIGNDGWHPPDGNGALSPTRYVELANGAFAIYRRDGSRIARGTLDDLTGDSGDLFDPVVLWDAGSARFYYVIEHNRGFAGTRSYYNFGYSTTPSPNGPQDFCHYALDWNYADAALWTDFPKMGTTRDFIVFTGDLFGSNTGMFARADAQWISKPAPGAACQDPSAFRSGIARDLRTAAGIPAYAVQPARQADPRAVGWLLSADSGGSSALHLFRVHPRADGSAAITRVAQDIAVPEYAIPPDAPQQGASEMLDSGGCTLGITTAAVDPARGGAVALWTVLPDIAFVGDNSTIATLQWFELDPEHAAVWQQGRIAEPDLYVLDGAIAPDRAVHGASRAFGDSMVLSYNTSSATSPVSLAVVSKSGDAPLSAKRVLWRSKSAYFCGGGTCRWGDYASASADPAADPALAHGQAWITGMHASTSGTFNNWQDRNALLAP
jgi:hypothetical protein